MSNINLIDKNEITLDLSVHRVVNVHCMRGDVNTRQLYITLTNNGKLFPIDSTIEATYKMWKADGTYIYNNIDGIESGKIYIDLTDQCLAYSGVAHSDLQLTKTDDNGNKYTIGTMPFNIIVNESVVSEDDIISTHEFGVLANAINKADNFVSLEQEMVNNEEARNTAEQYREENVSRMLNSGNNLIDSLTDLENNIIANERTRQIAESTRIQTYEEAIEVIDSMNSLEQTIDTNETVRQSQEILRETNASQMFEEGNELIESLETLNQTVNHNEEDRKSTEKARENSENLRKTSEDTRIENENKRILAEETRNLSEDLRINNEMLRQAQETERQINTSTAITNADKATERANKAAESCEGIIEGTGLISTTEKGEAGGVATLDDNSKIPIKQLPDEVATQTNLTQTLTQATSYTDEKITGLIGGAPETLDTLKELSDAIAEHQEVADAINEAIGTKANQAELDTHTGNDTIHIIASERTNWNDANSKKHEHSNKTILDGTTASYTTTEKTKLSGIASGAEVNQNAFSNITVGSTTISADSKTDTLTLVAGSNVTITPDVTNDKVTIASTNTDTKVKQTNSTTSSYRALLMGTSYNADPSELSVSETGEVYKNTSIYACPSTGAIHAKEFYGDLYGNAQTVTLISNTPTRETHYFPTMYTDIAGKVSLTANAYTKFVHLTGTTSENGYNVLALGNSIVSGTNKNSEGSIILYSSDSGFHRIRTTSATSTVDHTLPAVTGTILNTGNYTDYCAKASHNHSEATTSASGLMTSAMVTKLNGITDSADSVSFTQSLTSGTKVGTITINGTDTVLYAPTNTDTHYTTKLKVGASATATANAAATNGNVYLNVLDNTTVRDSHNIVGSGSVTVTSDANGKITITGTDTNTDTKVTLSANAPTAQTNYYPTMYTATSGTVGLSTNANIRYNIITGTTSEEGITALYLGKNVATGNTGNSTGKILLYSPGASYHWITPAKTSSIVTHTLPATSGTLLNSGTTSFTQTLTSGTAIGTIKINGTSKTIYAPSSSSSDSSNILSDSYSSAGSMGIKASVSLESNNLIGNILPYNNASSGLTGEVNLGSKSNPFNEIYANKIYGANTWETLVSGKMYFPYSSYFIGFEIPERCIHTLSVSGFDGTCSSATISSFELGDYYTVLRIIGAELYNSNEFDGFVLETVISNATYISCSSCDTSDIILKTPQGNTITVSRYYTTTTCEQSPNACSYDMYQKAISLSTRVYCNSTNVQIYDISAM